MSDGVLMRFCDLWQTALSIWPSEIDISDFNEQGLFRTLWNVYYEIEESTDQMDLWSSLLTWTMYQACHKYARELIVDGHSVLVLCNVPKAYLDAAIKSHLLSDDWAKEALEYIGLEE